MIKKACLINSVLIIAMLAGNTVEVLPQARIQGVVEADSLWKPMVYLSIIPDLSQLYSVSFATIIDSARLKSGHFSFSTEHLPEKDHFYRIHLSKLGDPPASLIIGGKDQNHIFLIAKRGIDLQILSSGGSHLFTNLRISGYPPNDRLMEIQSIMGLMDTLSYFGSPFSRDFVSNGVHSELKLFADTTSNSLVADYARYVAGQEGRINTIVWIWMLPIVILLAALAVRYLRKRRAEPSSLSELTIQERKVFSLLKAGKSNKEIAEECSISISTVKSHVNSIYSKMGIKSRKEALDYDS